MSAATGQESAMTLDTALMAVGRAPCSASSLRCEFRVGVELQEPTFLTAESSHRHTVTTRRFRFGPERFLRWACKPGHDKRPCVVEIIRHKPLDHFTFAFWTLHFFVSHNC